MNALQQQLIEDIRANGPLPFVDYMEYCLYAPGHGYYDSGKAIFGAEGDFITAPELGSLFARTLAQQVLHLSQTLGDYDLLEVGAGSGKLAVDILTALHKLDRLPNRYRILEKSPHLRQRQKKQLDAANLPLTIEWLSEPPAEPWQGILIANEVLDALPVEHFTVTGNGIERIAVTVNEKDELNGCTTPATDELKTAVQQLQQQLLDQHKIEWPLPYTSEVCLELPSFFTDLSANLTKGNLLFIDYGYLRHEFYHPQRHMGTLVSHHGHQGHFELLANPGEQDITAFVDFSAAGEIAEACGLEVINYQTQAHFLIDAGIEQVMSDALMQSDAQSARALSHEMKLLMLPGEMGEKFKVLCLGKN